MGRDKGLDLTEGDPPEPKDPPLHRFTNWIETTCGWVGLIVLALWTVATTLITLPLVGVIQDRGQDGNGTVTLILGCILGLVAIAVTLVMIWDLEDYKMQQRRYKSRDLEEPLRYFYEQQHHLYGQRSAYDPWTPIGTTSPPNQPPPGP
jgi:poly-beta-1,6-N-acetyl-D-glucosamine biosynthesis protein PgaD